MIKLYLLSNSICIKYIFSSFTNFLTKILHSTLKCITLDKTLQWELVAKISIGSVVVRKIIQTETSHDKLRKILLDFDLR